MDIIANKIELKKWCLALICLFALPLTIVSQDESGIITASLDIPLPQKDISEQILRRTGYVVSYNADLRIPNWVAWHLTAEHVKGAVSRPGGNAWHEDNEVPCPKATSDDYRNSGWSRGHMCPAGDCKWDEQAMDAQGVCPRVFMFLNSLPKIWFMLLHPGHKYALNLGRVSAHRA